MQFLLLPLQHGFCPILDALFLCPILDPLFLSLFCCILFLSLFFYFRIFHSSPPELKAPTWALDRPFHFEFHQGSDRADDVPRNLCKCPSNAPQVIDRQQLIAFAYIG